MTLATPQATIEILKHFSLRLDKSLGQHFLVDQNILLKIVEAAGLGAEDVVVEIGPGIGTLTQEIANRAKTVIAIELDKKLTPVLDYTLKEYPNAHPIFIDALSIDLANLPDKLPSPNKLVSNLPYQISTPLLATYLDRFPFITEYVFMVQKEVADRIAAIPGSKDYGAFSVKAQYYCEVKKVAPVSKHVFMPPPEVSSSIVKMTRYKEPCVHVLDRSLFFAVVKAAFSQRRKTLRNALMGSPDLSEARDCVETVLLDTGIDPSRRGETLSIGEFASIANALVH